MPLSTSRLGILTMVLAASMLGCASGGRPEPAPSAAVLSPADTAAIRNVHAVYVAAWLRGDSAAVLATLTPDAVLMPAGQRPLTTPAAIRAFWWPADGSRTTILSFQRTVEEVAGQGDVAWTRSSDVMSFTYQPATGASSTIQSRGMSLAIFRRQGSGVWRISRMMWGPRAQ